LDLDQKTWEDRKIYIVPLKINPKDKKERDQNIDAKPNIKLKTNHKVIDRIYKEKFEKFLYYRWIQKSIQIDSINPRPKKARYCITWVNCTY
jgi:hypothetical protein